MESDITLWRMYNKILTKASLQHCVPEMPDDSWNDDFSVNSLKYGNDNVINVCTLRRPNAVLCRTQHSSTRSCHFATCETT